MEPTNETVETTPAEVIAEETTVAPEETTEATVESTPTTETEA